jgi:uncharacterized protein (TIGR00255 family)
MIYSMTGFGRGQSHAEGLTFAVEISSVNRKNLEITFSLPRDYQSLERELTERVRARFRRGKVHVALSVQSASTIESLSWDAPAIQKSWADMKALGEQMGLSTPELSTDILLRLVQLHRIPEKMPEVETLMPSIDAAFKPALDMLLEMRQREGDALVADFRMRVERLAVLVTEIQTLCPSTMQSYRENLLQRLRQANLEIDLDDERILKEIALFADRCDISEEITRLGSHFAQFRHILDEGQLPDSEPIGRKVEFLLQEIHRETNTTGSKANNIEINRRVIEMKTEIERLREQIQNVE